MVFFRSYVDTKTNGGYALIDVPILNKFFDVDFMIATALYIYYLSVFLQLHNGTALVF